jgi:altronate dehydratase
MFNVMEDDMDLNAGRLLEGVNIRDAGDELVGLLKRVAEGEQPKAEINRQDCLSIHTVGPAF